MSLFPAYNVEDLGVKSDDICGREVQSLGSDSESTISPKTYPEEATDDPALCLRTASEDFYEDKKFDGGNLCVSTLHYPGRPRYEVERKRAVGEGSQRRLGRKRKRRRRYFEARVEDSPEAEGEWAARVDAVRRLLARSPLDEALWLRYVRLQEWRGGAAARLSAVEEACLRVGCGETNAWGARRLRAMAAALPPDTYALALREELRREKPSEAALLALWSRYLRAVAIGGAASWAAVAAAFSAARHLSHRVSASYPLLLYTYGEHLQLAGLWEQLVLLLELVAAMNFRPPADFPPEPAPLADEEALGRLEDEALSGGLPGAEVWARVERARADAHWRPAADADVADPQRTPLPADVADFVHRVDDNEAFLLLVQMLRLTKVPLVPGAGYATRSVGSPEAQAHCAEALLPLAFAARRLPPSHPARPPRAALAALLRRLLDPPHYFSDRHGYLGWVEALWEASCAQARDATQRSALLCWRLRWLCSLALLVDAGEEAGTNEARRIRDVARAALRRHAGDDPVPFAEFARLELYSGVGRARALRTALHALRGALELTESEAERTLFVARVVCEVSGAGGAAGQWALACAVLRRPLPDSPDSSPPPPRLLADALRQCEKQCEEIERSPDEYEKDAGPRAALSPSCAEWACARVLLAPPARLKQLRSAVAAGPTRYREQAAAALALAAGRHGGAVAVALAPLHPDNASLALVAGGAALWERCAAGAAESDTVALGRALPAVLRTEAAAWAPREAEHAVRALRRETGDGERGALLWALRVECEALAPRGRVRAALYAALAAQPLAKWVAVRGALRSPPDADDLADLLLERQLRLHALRDELFQQ